MRLRTGLILIVLGHLALGVIYAWATPIFETPDEAHHVGFVEWLRRGNGLPIQDPARDLAAPTLYAQEGSQPPLYYLLVSGATFFLQTRDFDSAHRVNPLSRIGQPSTTHNVNSFRPQAEPGDTWRFVMVLRLLSLALSCGTIWLTGLLAEKVAGRTDVALAAAGIAAFNPMMVFINASVSNDNLVMLLNTAALTLGAVVVVAGRPPRRRDLVGLGLLLGTAALTKLSGLVTWPIVGLMLLGAAWRNRADPRPWVGRGLVPVVKQGLLVFGIAATISGWWYVRNLQLYGELFGTETMVAIAGPRSIDIGSLITQEWQGFFLSFWAVFGVFTILAPEWVYGLVSAVTLVGIAGGLWSLTANGREALRLSPRRLVAWLLAAMALATLAALIRWTQQTYASQGRLMFGAIAPLALGLAYGWHVVAQRLRLEGALWLPPIALAALAGYLPFAVIAPRYEPPPIVAESELPGDLQRLDLRLGDGLDLLGYTASAEPRRPGEALTFTLYWRAERTLAHDDALALVAYGRDESVVAKIDTWPGSGLLPTGNMIPGAIYADRYTLILADTAAAPTLITLRVGLWRDAPENRLPTTDFAGAPIDDPALVVGRLLADVPEVPPPGLPGAGTTWGGVAADTATIRLDGMALAPDGALTLWWQGGGTPADATLFLHLLDESGQQIDQADGPMLDGSWPLTAWVPAQPFSEQRRFGNVTAQSGGAIHVRLGWYDPASGTRLPAWRPDGSRWPDDAAWVVVEP